MAHYKQCTKDVLGDGNTMVDEPGVECFEMVVSILGQNV